MNKCILCQSSRKDDIRYGKFIKEGSFGVHTFCLYLSSNLAQNGEDDEGIMGFLEEDIKKEVNRIASVLCVYCRKKYANIGCCNRKCHRSFHLVCGLEHDCQYIFSHDFSSYCRHHAIIPKERPNPNETCLICFERLCTNKNFKALRVILTPCCRNGWFHKFCLQKFALNAGYFFKCPLCNDVEIFREKLPNSGIYIPDQDAAWELEPNAFAELHERPSECFAQKCKNRKGRKDHSKDNPFIMCTTCGSTAIHKKCFNKKLKNFYCADCTVAFEERDSGRESQNSHLNSANNEDEYVDVCQISDKEDLQAIIKLMDTSNKTAEKRKDSSGYSLGSDEEMPHTTKTHSRIGRIEDLHGSDGEMPHTIKKHNTFGKIEDLQGSDDEMPHTTKKLNRIGKIEDLHGSDGEMPHTIKKHNTFGKIEDLQGSDDEMPHTTKKHSRIGRIEDLQGSDEEMPHTTKKLNRIGRIEDLQGSDEEMPHTTKKLNRIGKIEDLQGSDDEMPHTTKKHSRIGRIEDLQGSDEEMPHTAKKHSRIGRIEDLQGSDEEMPHTTKKHSRIGRIEDLQGSDEEMPHTTKKLNRIGRIEDLQGSDEEMPHTTKKLNRIGRIEDLQGSDEEMPHTTKKLNIIGKIENLQGSDEEMPHTSKKYNRIMLIENLEGSDEEIPHIKKKYNRFKRIKYTSGEDSEDENPVQQCLTRNINKNRRIKESNGKGSEDKNAKKQCCNNLQIKDCGFSQISRNERSKLSIRSETETSEGLLNDKANKPNCMMINSTKFSNDFEHDVVKRINEKSPDVFNILGMKNLKTSQSVLKNQQMGTISTQNNLTNSEGQPITEKERRIQEKLSNSDASSVSTIASESDDVFLQNFLKFRENKNTDIVPSKPIRSESNENSEVHLCTNNVNQKEITVPEKRNKGNTYFNLDTSCIAKRTRRKSLSCNMSSSIKNESKLQNDVLNVSCIAVRTRPRRACSQTKSFDRDMSYVFEKIRNSKAAFEFVIDVSD